MSRQRVQLAVVERVRRSERDVARQELGEALRAVAVIEEQEKQLSEEIKSVAEERRSATTSLGETDPTRLIAAGRYDLVLRARAQALAENRTKIEQEIERRRGVVAEAERAVKAIEKLQERLVERERVAEHRQESRDADDFGARQHRLRHQEENEALLPLK